MDKKQRRQFSKEFKVEALRLLEGGRSVREVAESFDLRPQQLRRWRNQLQREAADAFRGNGKRTALEEENWQLKRRIRELEEEKTILKKASAYFARHQR
jgi:transposase